MAELGAAFLCAHLGVQGQLRHAGYIDSWLLLLKDDDRAIFTAASKASVAADYLRSFSEKWEEESWRAALSRLGRQALSVGRPFAPAQRTAQSTKKEQPALFSLKEDCRPPSQKTACGRYQQPTLFEGK